ncbi:HpcH/HpaI aldolase/citrate lyase family protein [Devosia lacusdianchii]|uniref:HpcH/HpaI aldolase/citrate lyase family protein n=1 Tax=Devosia lacusdianchii TaxID=2917991 RepID=UPI001F05A9F8|nr:aldolase/citrate lyase family protein [Devosia sp. JXJ CY 41]
MRSLLYVPANSERFVGKAHARGADAIILDLEDAVAAADKPAARAALADAVPSVGQNGAKVFVRINADDDLMLDDAEAACRAGAYGLYVPKAQDADTFGRLAGFLGPVEAELGRAEMVFVAIIEDAGAVLNARAIALGPRLMALSLGGEDLALNLGAEPVPDVLRFPKLMVHYAAKAEGLLSFGMLRSTADYADAAGIAEAAAEARRHGFDGATCVHPAVVPLLNAAFAPSADELDWALRVVAAAEGQVGAFVVDGRMVDAPVIARARRILGDRSTHS